MLDDELENIDKIIDDICTPSKDKPSDRLNTNTSMRRCEDCGELFAGVGKARYCKQCVVSRRAAGRQRQKDNSEQVQVDLTNFGVGKKPVAPSQTAKADTGKPQLSLVPRELLYAVAEIRMYGSKKYGSPENWKTVEPQRYIDAAYRHMVDFADNPHGLDAESGLPHLWHLACNVSFLCALLKPEVTTVSESKGGQMVKGRHDS